MKKIILMTIALTTSAFSETKIINGSKVLTTNDEWRSTVSLKWQGNHYCGGTLIAPTWVLTAAHCLVDGIGQVYTAVVGDTVGVESYNLGQQTSVDAKQFIIHPSYEGATSDNDIGLVELETAITTIKPTAYDTSHSLAHNTQTKVAGWGNISILSEMFPEDLREALVPIVDTNICNGTNAYNGSVSANMLCAGYIESTRDSCQGDSGGPLIVDSTLVGIVSWGNGCAKNNFPGVYTKVQNYETWIKFYVPIVIIEDEDEDDTKVGEILVPIITSILRKS